MGSMIISLSLLRFGGPKSWLRVRLGYVGREVRKDGDMWETRVWVGVSEVMIL